MPRALDPFRFVLIALAGETEAKWGLGSFRARIPPVKGTPPFLVQHSRADLQSEVRSSFGPAHLLTFDHSLTHHLIDRGFDKRGRDRFSRAVPISVVGDGILVDFRVVTSAYFSRGLGGRGGG
jgi:hypothetical protein